MKRIIPVLAFACLVPAALARSHPSKAEVEGLLDIMRVRAVTDGYIGQVSHALAEVTRRIAMENTLSPEDDAKLKDEAKRQMDEIRRALGWDQLKPIYVKIFRETFTDDEVKGMAAFYQTPAGQAVITKMPQAMQQALVLLQPQIVEMVRRAQSGLEGFAAGLSAKHGAK